MYADTWYGRFADNSDVQWKVFEVEGGHEAFLTKPEHVAKTVLAGVEQLQAG